MKENLRVAIDTGGTFTDIVGLDEDTGEFWIGKASTTPSNTMIGVLNAVDKLNIDLSKVKRFFVHGSTTAINALIEKKGVKTAYIGTSGFRDVPEIRRYNRVEIFNPKYTKPPLIVPRRLRYEVKERMLVSGEVLTPLDPESVYKVAEEIKKTGVKAVAVCLHHAYKNPIHERKVRDILNKECPYVAISLSSEVAKEHREYERSMTTIIDAYIKPVITIWIDELDKELGKRGMKAELLLTRSDGGAMKGEMGKQSPVNTLLSGPAGGVMGGMFLASILDMPNLITMDMGGTSFDVSIIKNGEAKISRETKAEGYELLIPNLDIRAVGAGGGSIGWIDDAGALHVGPQSAGADPGPVCYQKGGGEPTVTDALVTIGYIDPGNFLGGDMKLNARLGKESIMKKIAEPLQMDASEAAAGMLNISFNHMVQAIRGITVERGDDPRDFSLLCYGGGGALFGGLLRGELDMQSAVIPNAPANFSAWGMLTVDVRHGFSQTDIIPLERLDKKEMNRIFEDLDKQGRETLTAERIANKDIQILRSIDMRYIGQEHSVNVHLDFSLDGDFLDKIKKAFEDTYLSVFGYTLTHPVEMVNYRITAIGRIPNPKLRELENGSKNASYAQKGVREVFDFYTRSLTEYRIYERSKLLSGSVVEGPALVEEPTTVTNVPERTLCAVDTYGHLIISGK
ncbi:MAG: hydantoinase/oxoprolinase family protein [Spirochaetes bacterium]|nr:hydantoinase/oxoprolinase family protein [Spirochaetota bacterium]